MVMSLIAARGSAVVKALCYKPKGHGFEIEWGQWIFFLIYLILSASLGPRIYSDSNRNEYQKKKNTFPGSRVRPVLKADNLTAIFEPTV
jgi:hypothetical protein